MRSMPYQRFWLTAFGLGGYRITYTKIPPHGVYDGDRGRMNNSFINCDIDQVQCSVDIAHTRKIGELDLVHELVHGFKLDMLHEEIDPLCERLIAARKNGSPDGLIRYHRLGLRMSS